MPPLEAALIAQPADSTPDCGPVRRPGIIGFVLGLTAGVILLGLSMALLRAGHTVSGLSCLGLFLLALLGALLCLFRRLRLKEEAPQSHCVLTDHLGFRIDFTCHDVAMTAFLEPDTLSAGREARLLCFLENQASRHRIAHLDVGPAPLLGLEAPHRVNLALSAGQAAVYVLTLSCLPTAPTGAHDLPIAMRISKPSGDGLVLRGARHHLHNLWTVHYATPYTVGNKDDDRPHAQSMEAVYLSLASVSEASPQLQILEELLPH